MKTLILFLLISINGLSQSTKVLVYQETHFMQTKSGGAFRLQSSNEQLVKIIFQKFNGKFTKVDQTIKEDRRGQYVLTTFYFKPEEYNNVVRFLNSLNTVLK